MTTEPTRPLTPMQCKVAEIIGSGASYADAARQLGIARDTVRAHVFAIATKYRNPRRLPQKALVQSIFGPAL